MEKHRFIIVFGGISILTILVVFLSCCYFSQIKNEQILKATYLFSHAVDLEKELMQPEFISFPRSDTGISSDSTVIETEKGKVVYKKNKQADSLALIRDRFRPHCLWRRTGSKANRTTSVCPVPPFLFI